MSTTKFHLPSTWLVDWSVGACCQGLHTAAAIAMALFKSTGRHKPTQFNSARPNKSQLDLEIFPQVVLSRILNQGADEMCRRSPARIWHEFWVGLSNRLWVWIFLGNCNSSNSLVTGHPIHTSVANFAWHFSLITLTKNWENNLVRVLPHPFSGRVLLFWQEKETMSHFWVIFQMKIDYSHCESPVSFRLLFHGIAHHSPSLCIGRWQHRYSAWLLFAIEFFNFY